MCQRSNWVDVKQYCGGSTTERADGAGAVHSIWNGLLYTQSSIPILTYCTSLGVMRKSWLVRLYDYALLNRIAVLSVSHDSCLEVFEFWNAWSYTATISSFVIIIKWNSLTVVRSASGSVAFCSTPILASGTLSFSWCKNLVLDVLGVSWIALLASASETATMRQIATIICFVAMIVCPAAYRPSRLIYWPGTWDNWWDWIKWCSEQIRKNIENRLCDKRRTHFLNEKDVNERKKGIWSWQEMKLENRSTKMIKRMQQKNRIINWGKSKFHLRIGHEGSRSIDHLFP